MNLLVFVHFKPPTRSCVVDFFFSQAPQLWYKYLSGQDYIKTLGTSISEYTHKSRLRLIMMELAEHLWQVCIAMALKEKKTNTTGWRTLAVRPAYHTMSSANIVLLTCYRMQSIVK